MRKLLSALLLCALALGTARQAIAQNAPSWARVQRLKPGTSLRIKAARHNARCAFQSATDDTLTCLITSKAAPELFQRADIHLIKQERRGRSTLIGVAPGAILAIAGGIGAATRNCTGQILCGVGDAALILLGVAVAAIGALIGYFTDFSATTLYRQP